MLDSNHNEVNKKKLETFFFKGTYRTVHADT